MLSDGGKGLLDKSMHFTIASLSEFLNKHSGNKSVGKGADGNQGGREDDCARAHGSSDDEDADDDNASSEKTDNSKSGSDDDSSSHDTTLPPKRTAQAPAVPTLTRGRTLDSAGLSDARTPRRRGARGPPCGARGGDDASNLGSAVGEQGQRGLWR